MYNDQDQNNSCENRNDLYEYEYHYRYDPHAGEPVPQPTPVKPRRRGLKITALVLCAVLLLGGAFGAGWWGRTHIAGSQRQQTELMLSARPKAEVSTVNITGSQKLSYAEIYAANVDSCVSINVTSTAGYNIFGQRVEQASSGSGFIITKDGYIVTNYHVIKGANNVQVTLDNGASYAAQVIGGDEDYDIAVIKVDPGDTELKPVVIGSSQSLSVGDEVAAIGNPLGELTFSMSEGIVSCLDREINVDGTPFNMIQITAAINGGNSGGPLFNIYGEVVGIVSAKYTATSNGTATEGLGFAIPVDDVMSMIKDIMENGQVTTRPYLGVSVASASYYPECGVKAGGYLAEIVEDGPADQAGLQVGDVITMIDSNLVSSRDDVTSAMSSKSYKAGDTVTITFVRNGEVMTTQLTLGSRADAPQQTVEQQPADSYGPSGGYSPDSGYGSGMEGFFERYFGGQMG